MGDDKKTPQDSQSTNPLSDVGKIEPPTDRTNSDNGSGSIKKKDN